MNKFVEEIKEAFEETGIQFHNTGDDYLEAMFEGESDEPLCFKFIDYEYNACGLLFYKNIDVNDYERIDLLETINKLNNKTCILGATVMLFEEEGQPADVRAVMAESFAYGSTKRILEAYNDLSEVATQIDRIF